MKPTFKVLYYLDHRDISLIEVKRTDLKGEKDKTKIYFWILITKENNMVKPLTFVSINSELENEKREFKEGNLEFNKHSGRFRSKEGLFNLVVIAPEKVPPIQLNAINDYLL